MKLSKKDIDFLVNQKINELSKKLKKTPSFILQLYKDGYSFEEIEKNSKDLSKIVPKPLDTSEVVEQRLKGRKLEAVAPSTGYNELDAHIKGFVPSHVYVLTADTNIGKTALAANFAIRVAKQGKRVLYIALEPGNTIVEYLASIYFEKPYSQITEDDLKEITSLPIKFYTEEINSIEMLTRVFEEVSGYDLVIIDHIGYFVTTTRNVVQAQSNLMKQIAFFAKRHKTAVMLIAHINKQSGKKKKINMDRISGSAAFKQDATDVLIIDREMGENYEPSDEGKLIIAKTKSGGTGTIKIHFKKGIAVIKGDDELYSF